MTRAAWEPSACLLRRRIPCCFPRPWRPLGPRGFSPGAAAQPRARGASAETCSLLTLKRVLVQIPQGPHGSCGIRVQRPGWGGARGPARGQAPRRPHGPPHQAPPQSCQLQMMRTRSFRPKKATKTNLLLKKSTSWKKQRAGGPSRSETGGQHFRGRRTSVFVARALWPASSARDASCTYTRQPSGGLCEARAGRRRGRAGGPDRVPPERQAGGPCRCAWY